MPDAIRRACHAYLFAELLAPLWHEDAAVLAAPLPKDMAAKLDLVAAKQAAEKRRALMEGLLFPPDEDA